MSRRICILTGSSLCHNPRAFKEASALAEAGFMVEVLGAWLSPELKVRDQQLLADARFKFIPVIDLTLPDAHTKALRLACRVRTTLGALAVQHFGLENRWQLGFTVAALMCAARRSSADLFLAHLESAMWVAASLSARDRHVGVDMEDWYSEDLLPEMRKQRPLKLLRRLERELLTDSAHNTCTSRVMSEALAKEYGCRPPVVIYNAFPWADRQKLDGQFKDRRDHSVPSLHWYSQTLGEGRGLEELLAALPCVQQPLEIHLRGQSAGGFQEWLHARLPEQWRSRVFIHGLVSNDELLSRIAEHDIGFAGEMKYCRSRDLTVTNKIVHYLLAGLTVVASDTAGQKEVAAQATGAVFLYSVRNPQELAERLNRLLRSPLELAAAKATALRAAEQTFCWERVAPVLVDSVNHALATRSARSSIH